MASIKAYLLLGLFGPKVDPAIHAFEILPTYEITADGFTITAHDIGVKNPEEGARMKLRWDEITTIQPLSKEETTNYVAAMFNNLGGLMAFQVKMSIETAYFIDGKVEKPKYYMTVVGREAKKGPLNMTIVQEPPPNRNLSVVIARFASMGVATAIEGPDIHYLVIFKKNKVEEMNDLLDAFGKAKGVLNVKT
jgi:hypothetical protein